MKFQSIKTSELSNERINQILELKESNWKYGIASQQHWFRKNVFPNDIHNLLLINDKLKGYTFLGNRNLEISKESKKFSYLLFSTLILDEDFRQFNNLSNLMKLNHKIISSTKKPSFLLCKQNKIKMYKFFGWTQLQNDLFDVPDHSTNLVGLVFNINIIKFNRDSKISFFYCR